MDDDRKPTVVVLGTGASNMRALAPGGDNVAITDPVTAQPSISGEHGKAWLCDLAFGRELKNIREEDDATLAHWIVEAPWAHPGWHSYSIVLVHLRPMADDRPTTFYLDDATHEMWVFALDPEMDRNPIILTGIVAGSWLQPKNFAAQFIEINDDLALIRIRQAVQAICDGTLSPDTDWMSAWAKLFGDNMIKEPWRK